MATPPPSDKSNTADAVAVEWHLSQIGKTDKAVVTLKIGSEAHALGTIDLGRAEDARGAGLGCEVWEPANHLGESSLMCGPNIQMNAHAFRARIKKGKLVVSSATSNIAEGDVKFSAQKRIAKFKVTGTRITANNVPIVDAATAAAPAAVEEMKLCKTDADCPSGESCQVDHDSDDEGRTTYALDTSHCI